MTVRVQTSRPEPLPAEKEEEVRQALKRLDILLDLKWFPMVRQGPRGEFEGRYALTCRWPQADKRWEMYHNGEIGEPYDILGMFETENGEMRWHGGEGAEAVDPSMVMDRALELLGQCDNTRESWKQRLAKSARHNRELVRKRRQGVLDETLDGMKQRRRGLKGIPFLPGADLEKGGDG